MKNVDDYLNDKRILNDPDMLDALEPVREIHAIRLKLQDESAEMNAEERKDYFNKLGREFLSRLGLSHRLVNLSGQGRVRI